MTGAEWTICQDTYDMQAPYTPHVVECAQKTEAKFLKLSVAGNKKLQLDEVKVSTPGGMYVISCLSFLYPVQFSKP